MSNLTVIINYTELAVSVEATIMALEKLKKILDEAVIQQEGVNYEKLPDD